MIFPNAKFVQFNATDGLPLPGLLFDKLKTRKVVMNIHGNGGASVFYRPDKYEELADATQKAGWNLLAFNNRGSGITNKIKYYKNKKYKRYWCGTSHELISDCVKDIDGAINFLKTLGYKEFALMGFSTGANKIAVYHYKKPQNHISKNLIVCGADDMGIFYTEWGKKKFFKILKLCRTKIKQGKGEDFMNPELIDGRCYSFQGMFDILNPNGLYNSFPFWDKLNNLKLAKKKLFQELKSIKSKSILIYGGADEYCFGKVPEIVKILQNELKNKNNFEYNIVKNADHGFTGKEKNLGKYITNFLKN